MRTITKAVLAAGFIGALTAATGPATAQAIHRDPALVLQDGPAAVLQVDYYRRRHRHWRGHYYHGGPYYSGRYYGGPYAYAPGYPTWNGCPPHYTVQDGVCKPYRGY